MNRPHLKPFCVDQNPKWLHFRHIDLDLTYAFDGGDAGQPARPSLHLSLGCVFETERKISFLNISRVREEIRMKHKQTKDSLDSKLQIESILSVKIRYRTRDIIKNILQLDRRWNVSWVFCARAKRRPLRHRNQAFLTWPGVALRVVLSKFLVLSSSRHCISEEKQFSIMNYSPMHVTFMRTSLRGSGKFPTFLVILRRKITCITLLGSTITHFWYRFIVTEL